MQYYSVWWREDGEDFAQPHTHVEACDEYVIRLFTDKAIARAWARCRSQTDFGEGNESDNYFYVVEEIGSPTLLQIATGAIDPPKEVASAVDESVYRYGKNAAKWADICWRKAKKRKTWEHRRPRTKLENQRAKEEAEAYKESLRQCARGFRMQYEESMRNLRTKK